MSNITDSENTSNGAYAPSFYDSIPDALKTYNQWVCYRLVPKKNGKYDKVPYNARTGNLAKSNDRDTWVSFAEAVKASSHYSGIGFVFTPNDPFCGIDLDSCRNPENGQLEPWASNILLRLDSYTEASPSGKGVHIICLGQLPGRGGDGKYEGRKVEAYDKGLFFTFTGQHLGGLPTTVEERQEQVVDFYQRCFPRKLQPPPVPPPSRPSTVSKAEILDALRKISAADYHRWLYTGMALHDEDPSEEGYEMWRKWSATCPEKYDETECRKKWWSFSSQENGVTIRTLFYYAYEAGWTNTIGQQAVPLRSRPTQGQPTTKIPQPSFYSGVTLYNKEFPMQQHAVEDILPIGLSIVAGPPKLGKSWFALGLSCMVQCGGQALNRFGVSQGDALYLALEDSPRRMQERLLTLLGDFPEWPKSLPDFCHEIPGGWEQLIPFLKEWLALKKSPRLIVIDTFAKVKPQRAKHEDAYQHDYALAAQLQKLAIERGIALLCVHHTKKGAEEDFISSVSGTHGVTGAADCVMVLKRRRGEQEGTLELTGRDLEERTLSMKMIDGDWICLGDAIEVQRSETRKQIMLTLRAYGPLTPAEVAEKSGMPRIRVRRRLKQMFDKQEIRKEGDRYSCYPQTT